MKFFLLQLFFLLLTSHFFGQNINLQELIKLNNYSFDNFDTYVTQKGFRYYQNEDTDYANNTSYSYSSNGIIISYISKISYKMQQKEMISFQTPSSAIYISIKNDLKKLGFKYVGIDTFEGSTFINYKKGNVEISLNSDVNKGSNTTAYEVSVIKYR